MRRLKLTLLLVLVLLPATAWAETLKSTNYSVDESYIGPGGLIDSNSPNYRMSDSIGDTAVGTSESGGQYRTDAGAPTPADPVLNFSVNSANANFGILGTGFTRTAISTFSVKNYTSQGYIVQVAGPAPKYNGRELTPLSTASSPSAGTEQFGMNLVSNTSPATVGSAPNQIPDGTFSYGEAATNYNTANLYRYVDGDVIARSTRSTGQTDYTITYIANMGPLTPAGNYTADHLLICVPTY